MALTHLDDAGSGGLVAFRILNEQSSGARGRCSGDLQLHVQDPQAQRLAIDDGNVRRWRSADRKREGRIEGAQRKDAQVRSSRSGSRPPNNYRTPAKHAGRSRYGEGPDGGDV